MGGSYFRISSPGEQHSCLARIPLCSSNKKNIRSMKENVTLFKRLSLI